MERNFKHTQQQGHEGYTVIREMELRVEPVEMIEGKWYEPVIEMARRVIEKAKEVIS